MPGTEATYPTLASEIAERATYTIIESLFSNAVDLFSGDGEHLLSGLWHGSTKGDAR